MMSNPLLATRVRRAIFHALRGELVKRNLLPDITLFPQTVQGVKDYNAAIATIAAAQGYAIEIFNQSSQDKRYMRKVPRMVLTFRRFIPGDLGGDVAPYYVSKSGDPLDPQGYTKEVLPGQSSHWQFDLNLVVNQAVQEDIMNNVVATVIAGRGYIPFFDTPEEKIFIRQIGYFENPDPEQGVNERVYQFEIPDIFLMDATILDPNVPAIKNIALEIDLVDKAGNTRDIINTDITSPLPDFSNKDFALTDFTT